MKALLTQSELASLQKELDRLQQDLANVQDVPAEDEGYPTERYPTPPGNPQQVNAIAALCERLGWHYLNTGEMNTGEMHIRQSVESFAALLDWESYARVLIQWGDLLSAASRSIEPARPCWEKALQVERLIPPGRAVHTDFERVRRLLG